MRCQPHADAKADKEEEWRAEYVQQARDVAAVEVPLFLVATPLLVERSGACMVVMTDYRDFTV